VPSLTQQNFLITGIGVFLLFTYFSLMQVRLNSSKTEQSPLTGRSQAQIKDIEDQRQRSVGSVTHIEPGIFEAKIPEKLAFPPDKVLQEVIDPVSGKSVSAPYFRYQSNDNLSTYEIGYIRLPEENFQFKSLETILDDLTKGEISRLQGTLKKETTVNESIYSAKREIEIESNANDLHAREVLIVSRPYAFVVCYTSKSENNLYAKKAEEFFSSFQLFKQETPKTIIVSSTPPKELQGNSESLLNSNPSYNQRR